MLFARVVVLCRFRIAQSINRCHRGANPHVEAAAVEAALRRRKGRESPVDHSLKLLRHISLRSRGRRLLRAEVGSREATVAARRRGAYGISGNRGVSAFTNSSRSWPRARSRPAAGVPSTSGLRKADQIPGSEFEVVAAAHVNSASSPKKRIMLSAACPSWQEIF